MKIDLQKLKVKKSINELLEFGIINIDKPSGPTSFDVSESVKKMLGLRKTSHFGTLDPKVTGVLPVALNRACKLTGYFIGEDKEYVGIMRIHKDISVDKIKKMIKEKFTGKIKQIPPKKSRVKRQEREREIKKFELLEKDEKDVLFRVECAGGTYIRKLIDDLGKELGIGAHMLELRRIRAGIFNEDDEEFTDLYKLNKIINNIDLRVGPSKFTSLASKPKTSEFGSKAKRDLGGQEKIYKELKNIIIPAEIITKLYPLVKIKETYLSRALHGSPIHNDFLSGKAEFKKDEIVCVFCKDRFIGMYKIINNKDIFAKAEFVMQPIRN